VNLEVISVTGNSRIPRNMDRSLRIARRKLSAMGRERDSVVSVVEATPTAAPAPRLFVALTAQA